MKGIIYKIDEKKRLFYCINGNTLQAFYLTNKLSFIFMPYLKKGVLVDFEVGEQKTKRKRAQTHPVLYFIKIVQLNPYRVHYDLEQMRKEMYQVLKRPTPYLFIDFEMTMPNYQQSGFFQSEIIQAGFVLVDSLLNTIEEESVYIKLKDQQKLNKRTIKFLSIDDQRYQEEAIDFKIFYERLEEIVMKHHPKWIIWGKNDELILNKMYEMYQLKPLAKSKDFIDLLKLHKDYFGLRDDIGLFKAYETYYNLEQMYQAHDAKDDALVTREVFRSFMHYIRNRHEKK